MALLKAKQLDINSITDAVLNSMSNNYVYNYEFINLVDRIHAFSTGYNFPAFITGIIVTFVNANSATIKWNPILGAVSYNLYCHPRGNLLDTITLLHISGTTVTITGLAQDTIYEVQVTPNLS